MWKQRELLLAGGIEISDSILVKKKDRFYLHLVVEKEVKLTLPPPNILAVDLGERFLAASVALVEEEIKSPKLHGRRRGGGVITRGSAGAWACGSCCGKSSELGAKSGALEIEVPRRTL